MFAKPTQCSGFAPRITASNPKLLATLVAASLILGGCASIQPEPLTTTEVAAAGAKDVQRIRNDVEPLAGALSLDEAIARAIKYNLERRVRMMEEAVSLGRLEVGGFDMLPKLVASAGYRERNNDLITRSKDSVTGLPSLANPYISSDRSALTTDLSFTWSLLDFGQSYYAAKQSAERALIAGERRRKALHLLVQDVRTAFWRAASAQKLKADVRATIVEAEGALVESRKAEAERLRNPLDSLRYQRQLLENLRLLEAIDQELSSARIELASLTNLPLTGELSVVEPAQELSTKWLEIPAERMEQQAIAQNADLRESFYSVRLATEEARRGLLRLFPGLSFNYAAHKSDDSYLINQRWNEAGVQLSFNLLGLLAAPAQMRLGEAGQSLAEQQRLATLMGVLTQVHLARLQLGNAYRQYQRADGIWLVDRSIAEHMANREQAQTQTKLDRIANQTSAILSELRRYQAMAQVHAATSKLQATLGLEPAIEGSQEMPISQLSEAVGASLRQWDEGKLPLVEDDNSAALAAPATKPPPQAAHPAAEPAPAEQLKTSTSSAEQEVAAALLTWATAWSDRNLHAYLDCYAPDFAPADGSRRDAWAAARKRVIGHAKDVRLDVADVETDVKEPRHAVTRFAQSYRSAGFHDSVKKILSWRQIDGRWLIVGETVADAARR